MNWIANKLYNDNKQNIKIQVITTLLSDWKKETIILLALSLSNVIFLFSFPFLFHYVYVFHQKHTAQNLYLYSLIICCLIIMESYHCLTWIWHVMWPKMCKKDFFNVETKPLNIKVAEGNIKHPSRHSLIGYIL
jgi:uncharacterized membrane protein YbhN (UPF0104 family)